MYIIFIMPELPEVETIVRQLNKTIRGEIINNLWTDSLNNLKGDFNFKRVRFLIKGQKIIKAARKGKNILISLVKNNKKWVLWIHLKLTGHLLVGSYAYRKNRWQPKPKNAFLNPQNQFIHWVFSFKSGKKLVLSDMRKFAKIVFLSAADLKKNKDLNNLGLDPLAPGFNQRALEAILTRVKGEIKKILLKQELISGIGNIYANEILWRAKISPFKQVHELKPAEKKRLFLVIKRILTLAVRYQGTSAKDEAYRKPDGEKGAYAKFLKVYQKEKMPCSRCQTAIKRAKDQSRSTFYCPFCQTP